MAEVYDIPFWDEEDARAQASAMARALRSQQLAGTLMTAMAGGQKAAPLIGQGMAQQGGQQMNLGAALLGKRMEEQAAALRMREQQAAQEAAQARLFGQQRELEDLRQTAQTRAQEAADRRQAAALEAADRRQQAAAEAAYKRAVDLATKRGELSTNKPLTESQGQAAMFLQQGASNLEQAMKMGRDIFPITGAAGTLENMAWRARQAGFPQMASATQQARQGLLLSIAEPIIRAESGAAVPESEVRRLALRYIPMPGETEQEHRRKLSALVGAIEAVSQKLPEWKAAEFRPFYEKAKAWAASYGTTPSKSKPSPAQAKPPPPPGATHYSPSTGKYYNAQGEEIPVSGPTP